jgi:SP family general alpha glucoside:H+ symporter-like MFS transporter
MFSKIESSPNNHLDCTSINPSVVWYILHYLIYDIQLAGYSTSESFKITIGQVVLAMLGNICSWFLVDKVGRRNLTIYGLAFVTMLLFMTGGLAIKTTPEYIKGVISLFCLYTFVYNVTLGATAYALLAEVSTARLRAKTASIGLALQSALYVSPLALFIFN